MENTEHRNRVLDAITNLGVCEVLNIIKDHFNGTADVARIIGKEEIANDYEWIAMTLDPGNIKGLYKMAEKVGAVGFKG